MKLMTPVQMKELDERAIKDYGIPSILLMEHAAYSVFGQIKDRGIPQSTVIVCGPGNNGGDGLALARQLKTWSAAQLRVLMLAGKEMLSKDGLIYYNLCKQIKVEIIHVTQINLEMVYKALEEAQLIIDAIFGTGLSRPVEGLYGELIRQINASTAYKISMDIPSGIDGNTGRLMGVGVKADQTVTFTLPKIGLHVYPGIDYIGALQIADIGIPKEAIEKIKTSVYTLEKNELRKFLPIRPTRSNKGTYGRVLIIGGQTGMSGAVALAGKAALKVGAGIVSTAVPKAIHDIMEQKLTEVMTIPLPDEEGHISQESVRQLSTLIEKYDVIAIGPGIGRSKAVRSVVLQVLTSSKPCVVDADALYFLKEMLEMVKLRVAPTVITPHPGEMAKILGIKIEEVLADPLTITQKFATENHIITVLKIERTIVGDTKGNIYINTAGNTGMAKGGSGDILTGVIAGLLAQTDMPQHAAMLGVYLHARAADIMKDLKSEYTIMPSDFYEGIDKAFQEILK
ncbi:MAG: NAD(P)H-hydrate dehydratase [Clostridia bacterium]|nr:NAD(P)H-hydrate dehydratase [Clostridia bacterium]